MDFASETLDELPRTQVQAIAKRHGVRANDEAKEEEAMLPQVLPQVLPQEGGHKGQEGKEDSGSGGAAPRKQLPVAVDPVIRKVLVEAAMKVKEGRDSRRDAPRCVEDYDVEAVERMLAEDPVQCTLRDGDAPPPIVTAAAYGAEALVASMITHAGAAAIDAVDTDGRYALSWAAAFDCENARVLCLDQPCGGGDPCGLWCMMDDTVCVLGSRRQGKLAVVKLLGPRSSAAAVKQALDTAKASRDSFQDNVDYHRQDARDRFEEQGIEEGECYEDDDQDVQVASDILEFAESLLATMQGIAKSIE